MRLTLWMNAITGQALERAELADLQRHAHELYEANTHIFEDELDALAALGVVPLHAGPMAA
jgi:hypothetical protein